MGFRTIYPIHLKSQTMHLTTQSVFSIPTFDGDSKIFDCTFLLHRDGEKVVMSPLRDGSHTFVGLAFKLEVRKGI